MADLTKIATCCYCGNRTILRLTGKKQHELSCGSCGAPLHTMKPMKVQASKPVKRRRTHAKPTLPQKEPRKKRRKGWISELLEDVWDEIEDIID